MTTTSSVVRLTQFASGGGCACKVPPGELERVLAGMPGGRATGDLLVGLENGDDGAAVRISADRAVIATADFFTPVVDDAYDWGRIAAANALSDVYAMGGDPLVAVNLLAWPRDRIPFELAAEVLRGGADVCLEADTHLAGGHSIDDPEPKYGLAVTGLAHPDRLLRNDAGRAGVPLTLTKPLGLGVLNNRHKATGDVFPDAVEVMTTLNRDACRAALDAGATLRHRRHGLRPARPPAQAVPGQRRVRGRGRGRGAVPRGRPAVARRRATCPVAAAATSTGSGRTCARRSPRTSCCCSPTPRPPAACWWPARCRATR